MNASVADSIRKLGRILGIRPLETYVFWLSRRLFLPATVMSKSGAFLQVDPFQAIVALELCDVSG